MPSSVSRLWDCASPVVAHGSYPAFPHGARCSGCFPMSTPRLRVIQRNIYGREGDETRSQVPAAVTGFVQEQFETQSLAELGTLATKAVVEDTLKPIR